MRRRLTCVGRGGAAATRRWRPGRQSPRGGGRSGQGEVHVGWPQRRVASGEVGELAGRRAGTGPIAGRRSRGGGADRGELPPGDAGPVGSRVGARRGRVSEVTPRRPASTGTWSGSTTKTTSRGRTGPQQQQGERHRSAPPASSPAVAGAVQPARSPARSSRLKSAAPVGPHHHQAQPPAGQLAGDHSRAPIPSRTQNGLADRRGGRRDAADGPSPAAGA